MRFRSFCSFSYPLLSVFLLTLVINAPAATFIIGGASLATTEGNSSAQGFLGVLPETTQVQILASDLAAQGLQVGDLITGVSMRINGGVTLGGNHSLSDFEITLSQAANTLGGMSSTFASNIVSPVLVKDGAYTFFDAQMPDGSNPNAFGQLVTFDTPYVYQGGDLVYLIDHPVGDGAFASSDYHNGDGTLVKRLATNSGFQATTGGLSNAFPVHQFTFESVPEPGRAVLLLGGLIVITFRRRKKQVSIV